MENPMAPPGYIPEEADIQFYKPLNPILQQLMTNDNFVSLLDLLDETILMTPVESEEEEGEVRFKKTKKTRAQVEKTQETTARVEKTQEIVAKSKKTLETDAKAKKSLETDAKAKKILEPVQVEMQHNPIKLEIPNLDVDAFIAGFKNNKVISPEAEVKEKKSRKKRSRHRKRSEKPKSSSSRHKNKSSVSAREPLISSRSDSQSSISSTERSSRYHRSKNRNKSPIRIPSPSRRSVSPLSLSRYKSRSAKRSPSPRFRSWRRSSRTPSRSPSPAKSPPRRPYNSRFHPSSRRYSKSLSRSPSPARSPPSRRYDSRYHSSSRRYSKSLSRSPSSTRSSPSRRYDSRRYSSSRRSRIRTPSRSPSFERLLTDYKSTNYEASSKSHSSSRNKSHSYQSSTRNVRSPEKLSSRRKSHDKSSRNSMSPIRRSSVNQKSVSPRVSPNRSDKPSKSSKSPAKDNSKRSKSPAKDNSKRSKSPAKDNSKRSKSPAKDNSKRSKSPAKDNSKRSKSPNKKSPVRQRKFPIVDEYSRTLAEEMAKRQIWDGSPLEKEEGEVLEGMVVETAEITPVKQEAANCTKDPPQKEQCMDNEEVEIINDEPLPSTSSVPKTKFLKTEIKSEEVDQKEFIYNSYYCAACQLSLNSEVTWQSHIAGKKHQKVISLQTVHHVARGSILIPSSLSLVKEDVPRFNMPPAGKTHHPIDDIPRLQPAIDNYRECLLGLQSVCEIRAEREVHYYCELCDAPCSAHSIMPHLIGYKHQLRFLREIDPDCYEKNQYSSKKGFENKLLKILRHHEQRFGRGRVKVFEERDDTGGRSEFNLYSVAGPSWRNSPTIKQENADGVSEIPNNDECLDTSKADFFCKLCDAHMNNMNMWESHVRGKRHLRNAKKIPGENISKVRSVKAPPHVKSKLYRLIEEQARDEIIVGLDSIRETQGPNGENYTCFPCGSNCTNYDIVDHLLLTKHKIRYLERLDADGKENDISTISQVELHDDYFRRHLIEDECRKMMERYGSGTVEVYITKK